MMHPILKSWPIEEMQFKWIGLDMHIFNLSQGYASVSVEDYTLWFIHQGAGVIDVDKQYIPIHKNQCILFAPGTRIAFVKNQAQILHLYAVTFSIFPNELENQYRSKWNFIANAAIAVQPLSFYMEKIESLSHLKMASTGLDKFKRNIILQEIIYQFLINACEDQPANSKEAVQKTIFYMEDHFQNNIKISDLASMASVGGRQYSHIFKQITGTSPMDYLHRIRIENAKKLLRTTSQDMLSIAHQVGFKDEFYFSRRFKQQVGLSPTVYLKNLQPRIIGLLYTSHLLALGVTPIGAPDYHLFKNEFVQPYLSAMQSFTWSPCDIEAIREMKPDLILGYEHMTPGEYKQFSEIAEVVCIPWQTQDVYQQLDSVAAIIDKRQQSQEWLDAHKIKIAQTRERIHSKMGNDHNYVALVIENDGFRIAGNRNMGHVLYHALQFKPHPLVQQFIDNYTGYNVFSEKFPFKELYLYDASIMFIMMDERNVNAKTAFLKLQQSEIWKCLKAVQQGNVHIVSFDRWWMYTPLAVDGQLDDIPYLLETTDPS